MDLLNIFKVIVLSSIMSSVIVVIILIIKAIFNSKLNSTFHYYIWLILLIKLIIPFGPQTTLNIYNICENFQVQSTTNQETQINYSKQHGNAALADSTSISSFEPSNKSVVSNPMSIPLKNKVYIEKISFSIWIVGVVLLIVRLISAHKKLRQIVRDSIKNVNNSHKEILYNCMKIMRIKTAVELSYSREISSPSLCGLLKPKILIPVSVAVNICDEEFKYIIMHELTHLKNRDIFINWVIALLSIIYWFNPILIYSFHKIRQDCEFSCDGKVISYLDKGESVQYGNAIIRVLELVGNCNRLMGTTGMVMNNSEIKRRIILISKYKKINIKGILFGTVVVIMVGGLSVVLNTSKVSIAKNATLQLETPVATSKSIVNDTSNEIVSPIIKNSSNESTNSIVPFLSGIVIYNSHPDEDYSSGIKITDVGALINDKLVKEGLKSSFIKCKAPTEYINSYDSTRKLLMENVKDYSNDILLDIHRNEVTEDTKSDTRKIVFQLTKNNPHYEANKKFVNTLLENINNSNQVEAEKFSYENGKSCFNQDLSNNSALIEIGNNMSSDSDIEACINALVSSLMNI